MSLLGVYPGAPCPIGPFGLCPQILKEHLCMKWELFLQSAVKTLGVLIFYWISVNQIHSYPFYCRKSASDVAGGFRQESHSLSSSAAWTKYWSSAAVSEPTEAPESPAWNIKQPQKDTKGNEETQQGLKITQKNKTTIKRLKNGSKETQTNY